MSTAKLKCACCEDLSLDLLCEDCDKAGCCLVNGPKCGEVLMSTELPDFTTAPAWMDRRGRIWTRNFPKASEVPLIEDCAPWTPLDTAEGWAKRIDRDELAEVLWQAEDDHVEADDSTLLDFTVDAVLAALPELMGGGGR